MVLAAAAAWFTGNGTPWGAQYLVAAIGGEKAPAYQLLSASTGPAAVRIRPEVDSVPCTTCVNAGNMTVVRQSGTGKYLWLVENKVDGLTDQGWWDGSNTPCGGQPVLATIAVRGDRARSLAAHPGSSFLGVTIDTLLGQIQADALWSFAWVNNTAVGSFRQAWIPLPAGTDTYTFVAVRADPACNAEGHIVYDGGGNVVYEPLTYRLIASNIRVNPSGADDGQYLAYEGSLAGKLGRQCLRSAADPTKPAYDGFDLRTDWVPPLDAELVGGNPGELSANVYLDLAEKTATSASAAIETAMKGLAEQQHDEAVLHAEQQKEAQAMQEEKAKLCGANNKVCDTRVVDASWATAPLFSMGTNCLYPSLACACPDGDRLCSFQDVVYRAALLLMRATSRLAAPVAAAIDNKEVPPAFSDYSGGALQSALLSQWQAVMDAKETLLNLQRAEVAAYAAWQVVDAEKAMLQAETQFNCDSEAFKRAYLSGFSGKEDPFANWATKDQWSMGVTEAGFSPAPLLAQWSKCNELTIQEGSLQAKDAAAAAQAWLTLGSTAAKLYDAATGVLQSNAAILRLAQEANLGMARHELELQIAKSTVPTSLSASRMYRAYDLWRAQALVESARRYALAARRAIEARYVVDLSDLAADEAFVKSPRTWADDVYRYDLSLPSAVGLSVGQAVPGGVYANAVLDYVANLRSFVAGYAVNRPTAVSKNEVDVVTLPGLKPENPTAFSHPDLQGWMIECGGAWISASKGCLDMKVTRARLEFTLDAWGRLNGVMGSPPFAKRYNARWGNLAVNFVGTGVRDCSQANDPLGCYNNGFILYDLTHVGPAWLTDFSGAWHTLGVPRGEIEGGKGLAAELWLDPLKDGWSTSYIAPVARTEFSLRPLGGAYELAFDVTPEIVLSNIERVQLLVGSTSWVGQE